MLPNEKNNNLPPIPVGEEEDNNKPSLAKHLAFGVLTGTAVGAWKSYRHYVYPLRHASREKRIAEMKRLFSHPVNKEIVNTIREAHPLRIKAERVARRKKLKAFLMVAVGANSLRETGLNMLLGGALGGAAYAVDRIISPYAAKLKANFDNQQ